MWPQVSHRWCEVSQRIGAPQLSQGARPPMVGWQAAGVVRVSGCALLTGATVAARTVVRPYTRRSVTM
jgi:hypothetical protein